MPHYPFFRIFYSATFTVFFIALLCLLLIPPGDIIRQAQLRGRWYDVISVAGIYLLTLLVVVVFYASRLYSNRAALAAIPKSWIPIDPSDLKPKVWRMVSAALARSRHVASAARPRDLHAHKNGAAAAAAAASGDAAQVGQSRRRADLSEDRGDDPRRKDPAKDEVVIGVVDPEQAARSWGHIAHPGWSAPSTADFPNLHYDTVVSELAHLLEAKAVSLAPPDRDFTAPDEALSGRLSSDGTAPDVEAPPDPLALQLLQRPASSGMREYVMQLARLGVISSSGPVIARFLARYERARFSDEGLSEAAFRSLMALFSDMIRGMTALDEDTLARLMEGPDEDRQTLHGQSSGATEFSSSASADRTPSQRSDVAAARERLEPSKRTLSSTTPSGQSSSNSSVHRHGASSRKTTPWATAPQTPHLPFRRGSSSSASSSLAASIASHRSGVPPHAHALSSPLSSSRRPRRETSSSSTSSSAAPSISRSSASAYASSVIVRRQSHVEDEEALDTQEG